MGGAELIVRCLVDMKRMVVLFYGVAVFMTQSLQTGLYSLRDS